MIQFSKEQRLNEIIADFCDAHAVGLAPSRDELIKSHPEFKSELTRFLNDIELFSPIEKRKPSINYFEIFKSDSSKRETFNKYELIEEIGKGGIGTVYKAFDTHIKRTVALKIIHKNYLKGDKENKRFKQEVESAAKLDHPNIVKIYDYGYNEGHGFIIMQFIDGEDLSKKLKNETFYPHDAAKFILKVTQSVEVLHQAGIIHRDIKPGNILINKEGTPLLTDFGLALNTKEDQSLTRSGEILGTPRYMSPEQAKGSNKSDYRITVGSDIYSIGVVLYHCITNKPPFDADNTNELFSKIIHDEPFLPRYLNRNIPPDLEAICLKCLEKDPSNRFSSVRTLSDDLRRFLENKPTLARPLNPIQATLRKTFSKKTRIRLGWLSAVASLVIPALLWLMFSFFSLSSLKTFYEYPSLVTELENNLSRGDPISFKENSEEIYTKNTKSKMGEPIEVNYLFNQLDPSPLDFGQSQVLEQLKTNSSIIPISKNEKYYLKFEEKSYSLYEYPTKTELWKNNFKKLSVDPPHYEFNYGIEWNKDSSKIYFIVSNSKLKPTSRIQILDRNNGGVLEKEVFPYENFLPKSIELSPDENYLFVEFRGKNDPEDERELPQNKFKILNAKSLKTIIDIQEITLWNPAGLPNAFDKFKNEFICIDSLKEKTTKVIRRWSLQTGRELPAYKVPLSMENNLFMANSGEILAISSRDKATIHLYDLSLMEDTLRPQKEIKIDTPGTHGRGNRASETNRDYEFACSVQDGWVHIYNSLTGLLEKKEFVFTDKFGKPSYHLMDMLVGKNDLWVQLNYRTIKYPLNIGPQFISHNLKAITWDLAINHKSNIIICGNNNGNYSTWKLENLNNGSLYIKRKHEKIISDTKETISFFSLSPEGSYLLKAFDPDKVHIDKIVANSLNFTPHVSLNIQGNPYRAIFSPRTATKLVVSSNRIKSSKNQSQTQGVYFYEIPKDSKESQISPVSKLLDTHLEVKDIAFNPAEDLVALATRKDLPIYIYDWNRKEVIQKLTPYNIFCSAITFSNKGHYLAIAQMATSSDNDRHSMSLVEVYETSTWTLVDRFETGVPRVNCLKFSPDDSRIVTADAEGKIQVWFSPKHLPERMKLKRTPIFKFKKIYGQACWIEFTKDGKFLVVVGGAEGKGSESGIGVLSVFSIGNYRE